MQNNEIIILIITAISIGFFHTIFGPDHYLPFIVIAKAKKWTLQKTLFLTFFCGIGHILSSIVLGIIGIIFGVSLEKLNFIEATRGEIAAYLFIGFGIIYFAYGIKQIFRHKKHNHFHEHINDEAHLHAHNHTKKHLHMHADEKTSLTPWVLFIIFVFGPCETLIPLLMYPAAQHNIFVLLTVIGIFGLTTILTMFAAITIAYKGINLLPSGKLEKFSHSLAGATILLSGFAIKFLGL